MAKFCTNCGATIPDEKYFCTECGTRIGATEEAPVTPPPVQTPPPTQAPPPPPTQAPPPNYQYQTTAGDTAPAPGSKYEPITTGGYIGIMLLMCIPIVGIILAIVWAFGGCKKVNKRNLARATLIMMVIGLILSLIFGVAIKGLVGMVTKSLGLDDKKNTSVISSLIGGDKDDVTNSDIEELEELSALLSGLEGLTSESTESGEKSTSDLIDEIADINREAEAANDGWPKSLRKYPDGEATATASYRTEIIGTTREVYDAWIADLKDDGFAYQDFYDMGMTEEDMMDYGWWATDGEIYLSTSYSDGTVIVDHMNELPDLESLLNF